jgi:HSP20 family protein
MIMSQAGHSDREIERQSKQESFKEEASSVEQTRAGRTYLSRVDIVETEDGLLLWADLPGVDEASLDVRVEDAVLTIAGTVSPAGYEDLSPLYTEYNVGNFFRQFRLSEQVDQGRIEGRVNQGTLELSLPKLEKAKPRRIQISAR